MLRTTVLLADDHMVVRQGLRALLQSEHDIEIVGEAETGREAVRLAKALKPDVVVMDIAMPQLNGLEAARQIIKEIPRSRVLILSSYGDDEYVDQLTEAGAAGYLLKQGAFSDVVRGIREAKKGNTFFNPAISKRVMYRYRETARAASAEKRNNLPTPRETEVLQLVAEGEGNKQIAAELGISVKMVEKHRQRLMSKLGIHHVAGLTRYAICKGIIETSKVAKKLPPPRQN